MPKIDTDYALVKVELLEIEKNRTFYYQVRKDCPDLKVGAVCNVEFRGETTLARIDEIIDDASRIENEPWEIKTITQFQ